MACRGILETFHKSAVKLFHNHASANYTIKQLLANLRQTRVPMNIIANDNVIVIERLNGKSFIITYQSIKAAFAELHAKLSVFASLIGKQCNAIAAQRIRRSFQIVSLYSRLYNVDKNMLKSVVERFGKLLLKERDKPLCLLLGAAVFSWDHNNISDQELQTCQDEILNIVGDKKTSGGSVPANVNHWFPGWEQIISRENFKLWRKPVSDSYLYEYKVYGTYHDLPAQAFFDVQQDLEYRKHWDKLVIKLDVVDRDKRSGAEVVHWIMHYPYPMYSREYVYVRRTKIDHKRRVMVIMSRSTDHPCCPLNKKYVRVDTLKSHMIIRPHNSFDDEGFDYILTYYDDPKAPIPRTAYNWMANTGVPDFVEKVHTAALTYPRKMSEQRRDEEDWDEEDGDILLI